MMSSNLVSACTRVHVQAETRLQLIRFLRRCLSRKGWDQNTSYHQLTTWANGTNQPCAGLDQNETRVMFLFSLGSSIMANQE